MTYPADHDNWDQVIYIDGVRRRCTGLAQTFYVDCDTLPRRRCSELKEMAGLK